MNFFCPKIPTTFNVVARLCHYRYELAQMNKHAFNDVDIERHVYIAFIPNLRSKLKGKGEP